MGSNHTWDLADKIDQHINKKNESNPLFDKYLS